MAQHGVAGGGGGGGSGVVVMVVGESTEGKYFRVCLESAAVEMHSALNTCRHVPITLGQD